MTQFVLSSKIIIFSSMSSSTCYSMEGTVVIKYTLFGV